MVDLESFLKEKGFQRIELTRNAAGHFQLRGELNGRAVTVIVDTGAGHTLISLTLARELGLEPVKLSDAGGGAGGVNLAVYRVPEAELRVGGVPTDGGGLLAMNHSHVNEGMACKGGAPVHVVLGADVFDSRAAVIDYGSSSLFLKMAP